MPLSRCIPFLLSESTRPGEPHERSLAENATEVAAAAARLRIDGNQLGSDDAPKADDEDEAILEAALNDLKKR